MRRNAMKLKNLLKRMRVFNLEHPYFVSSEGKRGVGKPESMTMLPLEVVEVPEAAAKCREIASALRPKDGRRPTLRVLS